jgi:hypothetical protein
MRLGEVTGPLTTIPHTTSKNSKTSTILPWGGRLQRGQYRDHGEENTLVVEVRSLAKRLGTDYLHRGIAGRGFERRFQLAKNVKVTGTILENGLPHVDLRRHTPEHMKPPRIDIRKVAA